MQKITAALLALFVGVALLGLAPSPVGAAVVYSYTGNNFDFIQDDTPPGGSYTTLMAVSGSFTLSDPLSGSLPLTDISPLILSYNFTDGRFTYNDASSTLGIAEMSTAMDGTPLDWFINLEFPFSTGGPHIFLNTSTVGFFGVADSGTFLSCDGPVPDCPPLPGADIGANSGVPGNWTVTPAVVPIPPAVLLFGSGLVALFGYARFGLRRRQQV